MNEIERITYLPVRLRTSLSRSLKDVINAALARARLEFEVIGMVRAVAEGFQRWNSQLQGMDDGINTAAGAYVRVLAIAIPDLFVVAFEHRAFCGYELDEAERKVYEASREIFLAKVAFAEADSRIGGMDLRAHQTAIIKQHPLFQEMQNRDNPYQRRRA